MPLRMRSTQHIRKGGGTHKGYISGSLVANSSVPDYTDYYAVSLDESGSPHIDHILAINKKRIIMDPLNGVWPSSTDPARSEMDNWVPDNDAIWNPQHLDLEHPVSNVQAATEVLFRTNPNKYAINGPVSFLELRELPSLLKLQGDNIIENAAGGYLSWQFGWKPLISDLKKLLDFNGLVNKKVGEIHALYQKGGLHRGRSFGTVHTEHSETFGPVYSWQGKSMSLNMSVTTSVEKWATVRWHPSSLPPKDNAAIRRAAIRIVYGLELSASNVWEAIPWSWLIDWFSNVGTYLAAHNNVVPVVPSTPCIMARTTTVRKFRPIFTNCKFDGGYGHNTLQSKSRILQGAGLSATMPFLTARQLSILGSLAILRLPGKGR